VPGARAPGALARRARLLRNRGGVEPVATQELSLPALPAGLGHDLGRDATQGRDEDYVRLERHGLRHIGREVGFRLVEWNRLQKFDAVLVDGLLDDLAAVAGELVVLCHQ